MAIIVISQIWYFEHVEGVGSLRSSQIVPQKCSFPVAVECDKRWRFVSIPSIYSQMYIDFYNCTFSRRDYYFGDNNYVFNLLVVRKSNIIFILFMWHTTSWPRKHNYLHVYVQPYVSLLWNILIKHDDHDKLYIYQIIMKETDNVILLFKPKCSYFHC